MAGIYFCRTQKKLLDFSNPQVETTMLWVLLLASCMSLIPVCTCHDGVFRVPLTLKHDYNVTKIYSLQTTRSKEPKHHGAPPKKKKNNAAVEITPFFTGPIVLGGQQFEVIFDTGSDDLWVFGNDVNKERFAEDGHDHNYYNNEEERTTGGELFQGSYGYAHLFTRVTGVKALDTCSIGGIEVDPCPFGVVNHFETGEALATRYDGIMGLSFIPQSVFTSMVRQRLLRLPMFSVHMSKDGVRGEILFGSWDERYFKYPFEVNEVQTTDYWTLSVRRLGIGNRCLEAPEGEAVLLALVDTGSSKLHLPLELLYAARQDSETLADALNRDSGAYGYVPCSSRSSLPVLEITIGTRVYVLTGEEYTTTVGSASGSDGQEWCRLEMDDLVPHRKLMVIGVPFFRKYYTMFFHEYDGYPGPAVAFAEAKHPSREA